MRAILDRDMILRLTADPTKGVEIGALPKGVGLERLRFDGAQVVDLATLSQMWVEPVGPGHYVLHAVQVPGSRLVAMRYGDRKRLIRDPDGTIRVPTDGEVLQQARALALMRIKRGFEQEAQAGRVMLSLGWEIDCRRGPNVNDVQNCEILLRTLQLQGVPDDYAISGLNGEDGIKGADNLWHPCTLAQLRDVVIPEMYQYGLNLYGRKWSLERAAEESSTIATLDAIKW